MMVEIYGPDGKIHYRRPFNHPDVLEALKTPGYSVRGDVMGVASGSSPAHCSECGVLVRRIIISALLASIWRYPYLQWINFAVVLGILHYTPMLLRRSPNNEVSEAGR